MEIADDVAEILKSVSLGSGPMNADKRAAIFGEKVEEKKKDVVKREEPVSTNENAAPSLASQHAASLGLGPSAGLGMLAMLPEQDRMRLSAALAKTFHVGETQVTCCCCCCSCCYCHCCYCFFCSYRYCFCYCDFYYLFYH